MPQPVPQKPQQKLECGTSGQLVQQGVLSKTGGYGSLLVGLMTLGTGFLASVKSFRKK